MSVRRRASQASVGLVVVGLHLVGVLVWWTTGRGMQLVHSDAPLTSIAVWLPALAEPDTKQAANRQRQQRAQESSRLPRPHNASSPTGQTHAAEAATAPVAASGTPIPTAVPGSAEVQTLTAPALNLNLSRKAITSVAPPSFAEQSPFHGRLPVTVERQIASAAAETGPWTEERVDNDHIRFRRGDTCIMVQRPRAASIDPFSEAAARIPWRASQPESCQ